MGIPIFSSVISFVKQGLIPDSMSLDTRNEPCAMEIAGRSFHVKIFGGNILIRKQTQQSECTT